jgi:hypothetical protein
MPDQDKLDEAVQLLVEADAVMSSIYFAIEDYSRMAGWFTFKKIFSPLKDRIGSWQDKLWKTDLVGPSPSASPSPENEE